MLHSLQDYKVVKIACYLIHG